jgi:hypothetical protein
MRNRYTFAIYICMLSLLLAACNGENKANLENETNTYMSLSYSGTKEETPSYLVTAKHPLYPVDSRVIILADHVPGMEGAKGVVNGAYETTAYKVSYVPSTWGNRVKDYKWVIHEDIDRAGLEPFKPGDEVLLHVKYKEGMDGAVAKIESVQQTTVYMVSYIDTRDGSHVKYYKWLVESELEPLDK